MNNYFDDVLKQETSKAQYEPLPDDVEVKAILTECMWECTWGKENESSHVKCVWAITEQQYGNRRIFDKLKLHDEKVSAVKTGKRKLMMLDKIANAGIVKANVEPDDYALKRLEGTAVTIKLGLWEINGRKGNYVKSIMPVVEDNGTMFFRG